MRDSYRVCRYRLPSPVLFDFVINRQSVEVLKWFEKERLLGVARVKDKMECDGVVFDFGNARVFCQCLEDTWSLEKMEERGEFVGFYNLVRLPEAAKQTVQRIVEVSREDKRNRDDPFMEMGIGEGKIYFKYGSENIGISEEHSLEMYKPLPFAHFIVPPHYIDLILMRAQWMGYKAGVNRLYFKDEKCEYVVATARKEGGKENE
jgi:hypothetical protein